MRFIYAESPNGGGALLVRINGDSAGILIAELPLGLNLLRSIFELMADFI
jgi:hypothetical protein